MEKKTENLNSFLKPDNPVPAVLLVAVLLLYIVLLYPNLVITRHDYKIGDVVAHDIKAANDFFVEDHDATAGKYRLPIHL